MVKIRRVLVVLIAALPLTVVAGATQATASGPSYGNSDAAVALYVGSEEGVRANDRYPEGSTAF
jgi:hypothetical protein